MAYQVTRRVFLILGSFAASFVGFFSEAADATMIDVQCVTSNSPPFFVSQPTFSGSAVVGSGGDFWNTVAGTTNAGAYFSVPLNDVANNPTPVVMNFFFSGFWGQDVHGHPVWPFDGTPYAPLMDQYAFGRSSAVVHMLISNLSAGPYDLYLYSSPSPDAITRVTGFTVMTSIGTATATSSPSGNATGFVEGTNYVHFQPVIGSDGQLRVFLSPLGDESAQGLEPEGDLNGFQLVSAPEPDAAVLAIAVSTCLLLARARGHRSDPQPT